MKDNKAIKILMTADTVGGVWTYCMELCRSLQAHHAEVHLVTMGAKMSEWQKREAEALQNIVVYETDFKLEWMNDPWRDIKECGEWLLLLEDVIKPDVIHLNCFAYGCLPFSSPMLVVAHSDVYSWFGSVKDEYPTAEFNEYFHCVKRGLENADVVVTPSHAMLQVVQKIYSAQNEYRVIYNGRSQDIFYKTEKQPYVFSMGRLWDEAKNIHLLARAASIIQAPVKIAGDDHFDEKEIIIPDNVEFLGKLSTQQVAEQLSSASVYVLPAKYEPFGLSALEAALSGCALVLGDIPSLREIWQDAAIYVDTKDVEALADAVNHLLSDREQLEYYQSQAFMRAKLFSSSAMCDEYINVYQQMLLEKRIYKRTATV